MSNTTLFALLFAAGLFSLEAFLRLRYSQHQRSLAPRVHEWWLWWYPDFRRRDGGGLYISHPTECFRLRGPATFESVVLERGDRRAHTTHIDSDGFRVPHAWLRSPPFASPIAVVLGGSSVYGIRNHALATLPYLLEESLRRILNAPSLQVLNGGTPGATSRESLAALASRVLRRRPQFVLLMHGVNDLFPRIFDDFTDDYRFTMTSPLKPWDGLYLFAQRSYLARLIRRRLFRKMDLHDFILDFARLPSSLDTRRRNFARNGVGALRWNLECHIRYCRAFSVTPVLLTIPFNSRGHDGWASWFPEDLWETGLRETNLVIRKLAQELSVPLLDCEAHMETHPNLFSGRVHFTDEGNGYLAEFLAEKLTALIRSTGTQAA